MTANTPPTPAPLVAADEFPHKPVGSSTAPWKDTWWFVARDAERDVVVEAHITLSPGEHGEGRSATLVRHGARQVSAVHQSAALRGSNQHGTQQVTIKVLEGAWTAAKRLVLKGVLDGASYELHLQGRHDAVDATALAPGFLPVDWSSGGAMRNVQHGMTFTGTVTLGGKEITVAGDAFRDRSWGWRESSELLRHGWFAFLGHAEDCTFSLVGFYPGAARDGANGRTSGWVCDAAGVSPAVEMSVLLDPAGRPADVSLRSTAGKTVELEVVGHEADTFLSFHDAVGTGNQWVIAMRNHHVRLRDRRGRTSWGYANLGDPVRTRPLEGMAVFP